MRYAALAASITTAIAATQIASAQDRLPRECRQQIVKLCGTDRTRIPTCLRERVSELSTACREEISQRMQARRGNVRVPAYPGESHVASKPDNTIAYGPDDRQVTHFFASDAASSPPLILFIHGGGWTFGNPISTIHSKADYFTGKGYAFASTGYRLVPDVRVEDQVNDIVAAIATLRKEADSLGFDPDRIVLMGHSAGAHLAAMVATEERVSSSVIGALSGVVLLDGAAYDVAKQMASDDTNYPDLYEQAFSAEPDRQKALSPVTYVGGKDAPAWLILHVARRENASEQARLLSTALVGNGAIAKAVGVRGTSHNHMNQKLGTEGDTSTSHVDAFLATLFN